MSCFNPELYLRTGTTSSVTWAVNKVSPNNQGNINFGTALYEITETREVLGAAVFNSQDAVAIRVTVTPDSTELQNVHLEHGGDFIAYYAIPDYVDLLRGQLRYLGAEVDFGNGPEFWEIADEAQILRFGLTSGDSYTQAFTLESRKRTGGAAPFTEANALPIDAPAIRAKQAETTFHGVLRGVNEITIADVDYPFRPAHSPFQGSLAVSQGGPGVAAGELAGGGAIPAGPVDVCKLSVKGTGLEPQLYTGTQAGPNVGVQRADQYIFLTVDTGLPAYMEFAKLQSQAAVLRYRMVRAYINGELVHGVEPEEP